MVRAMSGIETGAALVTGAGSRIGRAIALDLAAAGWAVAVHYNKSVDGAASVVETIIKDGGSAAAVRADLANEDDIAGLVAAAAEALGTITCLVNNASRFDYDTVATTTRESWDNHLNVNLRAPFVLSQSFATALPADQHGAIINLIDQRVWNLTPHFMSYTISKTGLWTLTRTLALALAPRIRVNGIGPGPTLPSTRQSDDQFAAQVDRTPLARSVAVSEICAAVRFILDAPSLTGQMIAMDSGQHLGWQHPNDPAQSDE